MAARYALRKIPVLAECQVAPEICAQVIPRLYTCIEPCVKIFHGQGDDRHAQPEVCGLLSAIERTTIASIAERFGQSRRPLQGFRGWHAWDEESLRQALRRHVTTPLGQGDGVRGCDPAGLPKSGGASVGVARQWCGRLGKVDPCQVAMDLGDVSRQGHTLVDTRRDLPKAWTKAKARLAHAGVPNGSRGSHTRHPLAWARLAKNGVGLAPSWRAGDDEMGRPAWFRRRLAAVGEREVLAVPSTTPRRALEVAPPGDDALSNAVPATPLGACARVATADQRSEACLQSSKSAAGLADDEGRHWTGWQHQQTLSLLVTWFLVRETDRGKKWTPALTFPQSRQGMAMIVREALQCGTMSPRLQSSRSSRWILVIRLPKC